MTEDDKDTIRRIVADVAEIDADLVVDDKRLTGFGIDSLSAGEVEMEIEEALGVSFGEDGYVIRETHTVAEIFDLVEKHRR